MTRRKTVIAVIAAVLSVCAVGAAQAAASTGTIWEECLKNAPNHTLTPEYTDSTCTTKGAGEYFWSPIVEIGRIRRTSVSAKVLAATIGGTLFRIQCTGESGEGSAEAVEGGTKVRVSELVVSYEGCSVTNPTGNRCAVSTTITTNSLKSETVPGTMQVKYEPTGATIATITVTQGSGLTCPAALLGNHNLTGTMTSLYEEAEGIEEFTETSGSALELGGQPATFTGKHRWCTGTGTRGRYATS